MGINRSSYDIIKRSVFTERSTHLQNEENRYTFDVDCSANKVQIRRAIEEIYRVHVVDVNTLNRIGKRRRVRYHWGNTPQLKRAVVRIKAGETIRLV